MHSSLIITLVIFGATYLGGFTGCLLETVFHRWYLIEQEVAKLNQTDAMSYKVTSAGVAMILATLWPWLFYVAIKEWYAKKILPK